MEGNGAQTLAAMAEAVYAMIKVVQFWTAAPCLAADTGKGTLSKFGFRGHVSGIRRTLLLPGHERVNHLLAGYLAGRTGSLAIRFAQLAEEPLLHLPQQRCLLPS